MGVFAFIYAYMKAPVLYCSFFVRRILLHVLLGSRVRVRVKVRIRVRARVRLGLGLVVGHAELFPRQLWPPRSTAARPPRLAVATPTPDITSLMSWSWPDSLTPLQSFRGPVRTPKTHDTNSILSIAIFHSCRARPGRGQEV